MFENSVREKKWVLGSEVRSSIQIRKLQSYLNSKKSDFAVIAPAYQWAEGRDEVGVWSAVHSRLRSM